MNAQQLLAVSLALVAARPSALAQCFEWSDAFASPLPGTGEVGAGVVFDDGGGPALFLGGAISRAGTTEANGIVRWDGTAWSALGAGTNSGALALLPFDDGSGAALFVGGGFTEAGGARAAGIARWDGVGWSALGVGVSHPQGAWVGALAAFDDGTGLALYAGGRFTAAGGVAAGSIARWDGVVWSAVGTGFGSPDLVDVRDLALFDEGAGVRLFACGDFETADGQPSVSIARWDGTSWSDVGGGLVGKEANGYDVGHAMAVFDDGTGPALYVGGRFQSAGGVPVHALARWDGTAWSSVAFPVGIARSVRSLAVHDEGAGARLFACGDFAQIGSVPARCVARWDGTTWSELGTGVERQGNLLVSFDDGGGADLYCGGPLFRAGDVELAGIARWDGAGWSSLGPPGGNGFLAGGSIGIAALQVYDAGAGPRLFAAGSVRIPDTDVASLARWDGGQWSALPGVDIADVVQALGVFDDGGGNALYVGGQLDVGTVAGNVVRWDGAAWSSVGGGVGGPDAGGVVSFSAFDDGGGEDLYATGEFTSAGGVRAQNVARWDGTVWSALGTGLDREGRALAVFDDGGGPALYAGGHFIAAGGAPAFHVARWDGASWSALGSGLGGLGFSRCETLCTFDDGAGLALYAGGRFATAGGVASKGVARWDGTSWSAVGDSGLPGFQNQVIVEELFAFDDGTGPALYAGGERLALPPYQSLLRWDGVAWTPVAQLEVVSGSAPVVRAFAVVDDGALVIGGSFDAVEDQASGSIARRDPAPANTCPNDTGVPFCFGDGSGTACPCANAGLPGHGCASSVVADGALLTASGDPAANTVVMHGSNLPGATTTVLIRSSNEPMPPTGSVFGDGLLCVGTPTVRLGATVASGGLVDVPVNHLAGADTFVYQLWYRNAAATFCDPAARFNLTNGFRITFP